MRRIVSIICVFVMGAALSAPVLASEFSEPENSFCIYGLSGMDIEVRFSRSLVFSHTFGDDASFNANPLVIDVQSLYNENATSITITAPTAFGIAIGAYNNNPIAIRTGDVGYLEFSRSFNSTLDLVTTLLKWHRFYMLPYNYVPNYPGITPTPFVNDGDDIAIDGNDLNNTIGAISSFGSFFQFLFGSVIPWAGFASLIILVFATLKYMLKG